MDQAIGILGQTILILVAFACVLGLVFFVLVEIRAIIGIIRRLRETPISHEHQVVRSSNGQVERTDSQVL
jgi:hypothetical protein